MKCRVGGSGVPPTSLAVVLVKEEFFSEVSDREDADPLNLAHPGNRPLSVISSSD